MMVKLDLYSALPTIWDPCGKRGRIEDETINTRAIDDQIQIVDRGSERGMP